MPKKKRAELIAEEMIGKINTGIWSPHMYLPSEKELADSFSVSRNTLREALQIMIDKHYLKRRHGYGTVVLPVSINYGMEQLMSISELTQLHGHEGGHTIISLDIIKPTEGLMEKLHVDALEPLYKIVRVHTVDGYPAVYECVYCPTFRYQGATMETFENSLLSLRDCNGKLAAYADCYVKAVRPQKKIATALKIAMSDPLLLMESVICGADGDIRSYVEDYFSEQFQFPIRRVRKSWPQAE